MKIEIFIAYKGCTDSAPFDNNKDPKDQLIQIAEKYKGKENLCLDVRYLNEITKTWSLLHSYYPNEKRFITY